MVVGGRSKMDNMCVWCMIRGFEEITIVGFTLH